MSKKSQLAGYVEDVVYDFATEVDPDERLYPNYASLADLRADLAEVIDGRVADWVVEQREKHEERLKPPEPDPDEVYDRMRDQKMLGIDVPNGVED